MTEMIHAGTVEQLQKEGPKVVKGNKQVIAVFYHEDEVYAVNNRCPHMGFPLHLGSLCDGILTCHWHHARFDVKSGGTLDPWAGDVTTYRTLIDNGDVWVEPIPRQNGQVEKLRNRLREGLEQNISLVIAKAVVGLVEAGVEEADIARIGIEYGTTHRRGGWRSGLTILTAMVNILPKLDKRGRILALYQGLVYIARESAGEGTRFLLEALPEEAHSIERLSRWYRRFIEVRDTQGAERVLLTAIRSGATDEQLTDMMMTAVTDHFYMDGGHALDFHNKAFEILRHIGDEHKERVLASQLPQMGGASRSEEMHSWQSPINLVKPLEEAFQSLPDILNAAERKKETDEEALVDQLLSDRPDETVEAMLDALRAGMKPARLAQLVTLAAAERIARFHVQNEFADWITVLHTFTHAHAVHESLLRSPNPALVRGVFHGAMSVYLDRFLNVPSARLSKTVSDSVGVLPPAEQLLDILNEQQQVAEAADWTARYLTNGGDKAALFNVLGHALLREDAEFHSFQMYEAAVIEHDRWEAESSSLAKRAQQTMLIAAVRYLAAHAPTARETPHTASIAWRLHQGEKLFEEE